MKHLFSVMILVACAVGVLGYQNCSRHSFSAPSSSVELDAQEILIPSNTSANTKVIFLVDDSASMGPMQQILADGVKELAEKKLIGSKMSYHVLSSTVRENILQDDSAFSRRVMLPNRVGQSNNEVFTDQTAVKLFNDIKKVGVAGGANERLRHRIAMLLADKSDRAIIKNGDNVAIIAITDEDDPDDIPQQIDFEKRYTKSATLGFKANSTKIDYSYLNKNSDGSASTSNRLYNSISVEPEKVKCSSSTSNQLLQVIREKYVFNPSISQAEGLTVTGCTDNVITELDIEIAQSAKITINGQQELKFDIGSQPFDCSIGPFIVKQTNGSSKSYSNVRDYFDDLLNLRITAANASTNGFQRYELSNRTGNCIQKNEIDNSIPSINTKLSEVIGNRPIDDFIKFRLNELVGDNYHFAAIVSTDSNKLQSQQSIGQRLIGLADFLGGTVQSIHSADYSDALEKVGEFLLKKIGLLYPVDPKVMKTVQEVKIKRGDIVISLVKDTDFNLLPDAILFKAGVLNEGDRILISSGGAL